jgi:hypothetical protein
MMRSGRLKIPNGRTLAQKQKLGVGGHNHVGRRVNFRHDALDVVADADRHGRLGDNHREAAEVRRDFACGSVDVGKIGMAIAAPRWSADSDEDRVRVR